MKFTITVQAPDPAPETVRALVDRATYALSEYIWEELPDPGQHWYVAAQDESGELLDSYGIED